MPQKEKQKDAASTLPKEALEFARKMGADLTGIEAEAEDMWAMLNDMSNRSEYEYSEFIQEQMNAAKAEEQAEKEGTSTADKVRTQCVLGGALLASHYLLTNITQANPSPANIRRNQ